MQLLPRGIQELPRAKEKPHRSSSWTSKSCYRCGLPRVRAGTRRRVVWNVAWNRSWKGPRPFVLRQKRQTATAIAIPGKTVDKASCKETPLRQPTRESQVGQRQKLEQPAPASTPLLQPTRLPPCQLLQRAGLKVTSSIQPDLLQFEDHVDPDEGESCLGATSPGAWHARPDGQLRAS